MFKYTNDVTVWIKIGSALTDDGGMSSKGFGKEFGVSF